MKILISSGANVNIATNTGFTPLMRAAFRGDLGQIKLLLANGADATLKQGNVRTALDYARDGQGWPASEEQELEDKQVIRALEEALLFHRNLYVLLKIKK